MFTRFSQGRTEGAAFYCGSVLQKALPSRQGGTGERYKRDTERDYASPEVLTAQPKGQISPADGYRVNNKIVYEPAGTPKFNYELRITNYEL
jgi:hypothetical protein